jgi:enoyl-CoA hydratase
VERRPTGLAAWESILRRDCEAVMRFWHSPKPTIAAVRGPCLAGGFELALACDLTIAAEDAFFGEPELKFGAGIVVMLLPWPVGPKTAKEIILLGEDRLSAARAEAIGIVNRVIPAAKLEGTTLTVARDLAAIDPELVRRTRPAINRSFDARGMLGALAEALTIDLLIEGEGSPDKIQFMTIARREGLKAALSWRDTRFPGGAAQPPGASIRALGRPAPKHGLAGVQIAGPPGRHDSGASGAVRSPRSAFQCRRRRRTFVLQRLHGAGERIRTSDLLITNQVRGLG